MKNRKYLLFIYVVLIVVSCLIAISAYGQTTGFYVHGYCVPGAEGGSCGQAGVLAGSCICITVINEVDEPLLPLNRGWPEGYTLEASIDPSDEGIFIPTPGLIQQMEPTRFIDALNRTYELSLIKQDGSNIDARDLNRKNFMLHIPYDLAGHKLSLRCLCNKGGINAISSPSWIYTFVAPCSRADTARILGSEIYYAWVSFEIFRGVAIADSMLQNNLSDDYAWHWAQLCATSAGRPDRELAYLDKTWQDFGYTYAIDNQTKRSSAAFYENKRSVLQRMIEKMQNRQQQQN